MSVVFQFQDSCSVCVYGARGISCIVQLLSGSAELCVPETNTTVKPYPVGIECCGEWLHACVQTQRGSHGGDCY